MKRCALWFAAAGLAAHAADLPIAVDGAPVAVTSRQAGDPVRLTFRAQAGQHIGLAVSGLAFSPASASGIGVTVTQPGGTMLRGIESLYCFPDKAGRACDGEFTVAKTGTHVIDVDVPFSAAPRFSIQLSNAITGRLTIGKSESVTLSRAGQDGRFTLDVAAGQDVTVDLRDIASDDADARFALRVYRPDGALLGQASANARNGASVALGGAVPAGTYVVEVDPDHGGTGRFLVSAKVAAQAAEGPIEISSAVNQPLRFAFAASAGQSVTAGIDKLIHAPDVDSNSLVEIYAPDGSRIAFVACRTATQGARAPCSLSARDLPAGNYTMVVKPPPGAAVSGTLYRTTDLVAKLEGSAPRRVDLQPGQSAQLTFSANAGDKVGVKVERVVPGDRTMMFVKIVGPNTASMPRMLLPADAALQIDPIALAAAGTYTVVVDAKFSKASASVSLLR